MAVLACSIPSRRGSPSRLAAPRVASRWLGAAKSATLAAAVGGQLNDEGALLAGTARHGPARPGHNALCVSVCVSCMCSISGAGGPGGGEPDART